MSVNRTRRALVLTAGRVSSLSIGPALSPLFPGVAPIMSTQLTTVIPETQTVRKVRLFLASPGDVQRERDSIVRVVTELNNTIGYNLELVIELVRWETHAHPAMGRPQGVINAQIGDYDIFLGIMWKCFGTSTGQADSGTEEEFNLAYEEWTRDNRLQILFYFSQAKYALTSVSETEQAARVLEFKEKLKTKGLIWEYPNASEFPNKLRQHLTAILFEKYKERYRMMPNLPLSFASLR